MEVRSVLAHEGGTVAIEAAHRGTRNVVHEQSVTRQAGPEVDMPGHTL
jgi:hypothetical protein